MALPLERDDYPAPTDAFSGLPLPILVIEDAGARLCLLAEMIGRTVDTHHGFYDKRRVLRAENGELVRALSLQEAEREAHTRHHKENPDGPPLPQGNALVRAAVLASAGYVPAYGVGFTVDGVEERVPIPLETRTAAVCGSDEATIRVENLGLLKTMFLDLIVHDGMTSWRRRELGRLLREPDVANKAEYVRTFILEASDVALQPVQDHFAHAWERGELPLSPYERAGLYIGHLLATRDDGSPNKKLGGRLQQILATL